MKWGAWSWWSPGCSLSDAFPMATTVESFFALRCDGHHKIALYVKRYTQRPSGCALPGNPRRRSMLEQGASPKDAPAMPRPCAVTESAYA